MANEITTDNINTKAQEVSSIGDGDYVYVYKAGSQGFSRINVSLMLQGGGSGSTPSNVMANVDLLQQKIDELIGKLANLALNSSVDPVGDLDWGGSSGGGGGGDDPVTPTPVLTYPASGSAINIGTIASDGTSVTKSVTIKGSNLTQSLSLSVTGTGISVSQQTISASDANNGTSVTLTYTNSESGAATVSGSLTISSSEVSRTVSLAASKEAESGGGDEPASDYVASGLVLHLDGTDRGSTSGHWISKVGNYDFTLGSGATEQSNGVQFDADNEWGTCNNAGLLSAIPDYADGTIEVCFTPLASFGGAIRTLVSPPTAGKIGAAINGNGSLFYFGAADTSVTIAGSLPTAVTGTSMQCISVCADRIVQSNNVATAFTNAKIVPNSMSALAIGGCTVAGAQPKYAMAVIHAIRIYNRKLSESEMKSNQAIDLEKYGN